MVTLLSYTSYCFGQVRESDFPFPREILAGFKGSLVVIYAVQSVVEMVQLSVGRDLFAPPLISVAGDTIPHPEQTWVYNGQSRQS